MNNFRSPQRPKKNTLVIGKEAIEAAINEGKQLDKIYVQNNLYPEIANELRRIASQNLIPINYVPAAKMNSFNVGDHNGSVGVLSAVRYYDLQEIISFVVEKGELPLFLMLDGITDIRNIGGIARTAFCCGVHALIIPDKGVGALNDDAVSTSAGALEKLAVCRVNSLMKAVDILHLNGIKALGSEMTAPKKVSEVNFNEPLAIIMGSEEKGIYPALLKYCDEQFKIPMIGDFESLNVSVATGMILYECMKQRRGFQKALTTVT